MAREKIINGVNVDQLFNTIETIKKNPEVAQFKFRATPKSHLQLRRAIGRDSSPPQSPSRTTDECRPQLCSRTDR